MPEAALAIPTIDLAPFMAAGEETGRQTAKELIAEACADYGFFQIVNHGIPLELMKQAMDVSKTFFSNPDEVKSECSSKPGAPLPAGYNKQPENSLDKNEYLLMFPPGSSANIIPTNPPDFRGVLEELFKYFVKTAETIENIVNECLGLPPNFLKDFNNDRSWDFMVMMHYFPGTDIENNGIIEHEDANIITFIIEEDVGGLEVLKNGEWIPVVPSEGTLVVNLGDVVQVLSNKKFKSATHRVVRPKGRDRHSCVFAYTLLGDKWVEPLPNFGEKPKYKGFYYKDYQALRLRNKTHPPSTPQEIIHINHYEI